MVHSTHRARWFAPDGRTLAFRGSADGKGWVYLLKTTLPEDLNDGGGPVNMEKIVVASPRLRDSPSGDPRSPNGASERSLGRKPQDVGRRARRPFPSPSGATDPHVPRVPVAPLGLAEGEMSWGPVPGAHAPGYALTPPFGGSNADSSSNFTRRRSS